MVPGAACAMRQATASPPHKGEGIPAALPVSYVDEAAAAHSAAYVVTVA